MQLRNVTVKARNFSMKVRKVTAGPGIFNVKYSSLTFWATVLVTSSEAVLHSVGPPVYHTSAHVHLIRTHV